MSRRVPRRFSRAPLVPINGGRRPAPRQQPAIAPPFDPSPDQYGNVVHTTLQSDFNPSLASYFLQADFGGMMISGDWVWEGPPIFGAPGSQVRIINGPWTGLVIPFLAGANSTPPTMLMSPMLILYPRAVQDAYLTEAAWRAYTEIVIAPGAWNADRNQYEETPQKTVQFAQYCQSWGFKVPLWNGIPTTNDLYLQAMVDAHAVSFYVVGEEIDGKIDPRDLPAILDATERVTGAGIPVGVHFTAAPFLNARGERYPEGGSYPIGVKREFFLAGDADPQTGYWQQWQSLVLCEQLNPDDTAGLQGAMLGYAVNRVQGKPIYLWEIMATAQLYGQCTELGGKLRTWESLCTPVMKPGYANGCSQPDGIPVYVKAA